MSTDRERDDAGRPRNARPRDELGRPLPRGESGVFRVPDDLVLSPADSLIEAQRLLDEGLPFHAHEVLEATWKAAPDAERDLWQGLAQLAVGLTHALRGNSAGAATLLRRGSDRISAYTDNPPYGIDVRGLLDWARSLAGLAESDGPPIQRETPVVALAHGNEREVRRRVVRLQVGLDCRGQDRGLGHADARGKAVEPIQQVRVDQDRRALLHMRSYIPQ